MRFFVALIVASVLSTALGVQAQELPPPPPPPGVDEAEAEDVPEPDGATTDDVDTVDSDVTDDAADESSDTAESTDAPRGLTISEPAAGAQIATATVVKGTAPPRSTVEIWIDDAMEQRMKADANGQYKATISGLEPGTRVRIEVRQIDNAGEMVANTSVVGRVSGEAQAETVENPVIVEESQPEEPAPLAEREPETRQPSRDVPQRKIEAPVGQFTRGALATGAGVLGSSLGAGAGFFGGLLIGAVLEPDSFAFLAYAVFGTLIGYAAMMPLSVYLTGYFLDGDGNVLLTVLATYAGLAAAVLASAAIVEGTNMNSDIGATAIVIGVTLIGSASGALVFELTSNPSRKAAEQAEGGLTIAPTIAPSSDGRGAVLGLGGTW